MDEETVRRIVREEIAKAAPIIVSTATTRALDARIRRRID